MRGWGREEACGENADDDGAGEGRVGVRKPPGGVAINLSCVEREKLYWLTGENEVEVRAVCWRIWRCVLL